MDSVTTNIRINPKKSRLNKPSKSRIIFNICNITLISLLTFCFLAPYVNILAKSLNSAKDTMYGGLTFWPRVWTWSNFSLVLQDPSTWTGFRVSVLRVILGSVIAVSINYMTAYALLRRGLHFKKAIIFFFTVPMFISGGLISQYIFYARLQVLDSFAVYVIPGAFSFYNMVIIRTYLMGIPESLLESARIDGAGEITILIRIMLPLSGPIVATMFLWSAVSHWNDWTTTLYFIENKNLFTLQYNLQQSVKEADSIMKMISDAIESGRPIGDLDTDVTGESIMAAQLIFTTLPIVCVYPFVQRYFMSGVMIGSVKE